MRQSIPRFFVGEAVGEIDMKKVLFIVNPKSGKGMIRGNLVPMLDTFTKAEYDITIYISQDQGDARRKAREDAEKFEMIICSGGDGTLDEVISGMLDSNVKRPIGYIPAGSTNDFANSLGLPKNMQGAAERIVEENEFPCDIGCFNGDYFVYIAAFGLFTDVSYETSQDIKNVLGHVAYILEGAKKLTSIKSYHVDVEANETLISGEFIYGMVTNSMSVGGFKNITGKYVHLDDGVFEVTLIRTPKTMGELQEIITSVISLTPDDKYFYQFRSSSVKMTFQNEVPWTLDGEFGGNHAEVQIDNLEQAITVLI